MGWLGRHRSARVVARVVLVLVSCEATLALGAGLLERFGGNAGAAAIDGAIVCVGDSNTFGIGAPPGRSYPDQLRERLRAAGDDHAVVNFGLSGLDTEQMVDRLDRRLGSSRPSCIVFLGGTNDLARPDALVETRAEGSSSTSSASAASAVLGVLRRSRTFRVLLAAVRVAQGEAQRAEFGGRARADLPDPRDVTFPRWDTEYARAKRGSFADVAAWIRFFWFVEDPQRIDRTLADLRARSDFPAVEKSLSYPFVDYEWEADLLAGRSVRALPSTKGASPLGDGFAQYTRVWCALADGRSAEVRTALTRWSPLGDDPWGRSMRDLLLAWCDLIDRDFARAAGELGEVAERSRAIAPPVGLHAALGGGALATLLGDDSTRLAGFVARHPAWNGIYFGALGAPRQEWMAAAVWVDAVKSGDAAAMEATRTAISGHYGGKATTRPLAWLFAHPDAGFARVRAELPLEPPRTTWIGTTGRVFRWLDDSEFRRVTNASFARLAALARARDLPVVVLTYLDYESERQNRCLRDAATAYAWTLVDLHVRHARAELAAEDKRRFFSADRGHPNEAGYALMADAVLEGLRERGIVALPKPR